MSEHMAAEIRIGGKVSESVVPGLCEAIAHEVVALDWGDGRFWPRQGRDLLEARKDCEGVRLLCLYDTEARWGEFEELEKFLREHEIAFDRYSDPKYEFEAELAHFRPGRALVVLPTDPQHQPIVRACELKAMDETLTAALQLLTVTTVVGLPVELAPIKAFERVQEAQQLLRKRLPPDLPPLETFTIEEGQHP